MPAVAKTQVILQIDGVNDELFASCRPTHRNVLGFFDTSHGAGVVPVSWPRPGRVDGRIGVPVDRPYGYGGGLGPDNLVRQLAAIREAAGEHPLWIDAETQLRTGGILDMAKVRAFLTLAAEEFRGDKS
jgi:hypothetical protein